jgi:glycosyltransferase involved in cell wall biosynthesis
MHLIARGVKEKLDIPWVADFRDPWTDIVFYERLPLTKWADRKQKSLEQSVILEADALVQVAPQWAKRLRMSGAPHVETITNGFDEDEMPEPRNPGTDKFRINHTGSMTADRNHEVFWEALRAVSKGLLGFKGKLEIELVGRVDPSVVDSAIRYGFGGNLVQAGYVPHAQAVDRMASAHCLLLPINRTDSGVGFIPGKLFEYMGSGRPIIVIGPKGGDAEQIVKESQTGVGVGFDDFHNLKTVFAEWYELAKNGELNIDPSGIEAFTRRNLTRRMAELLDRLTGSAEGG